MAVRKTPRAWVVITLLILSMCLTFIFPSPSSRPPPNAGIYINTKENHLTTLCGMSASEVAKIREYLEPVTYSETQKMNIGVKEGDRLRVRDSSLASYLLRKVCGVRIGTLRWVPCGHQVSGV